MAQRKDAIWIHHPVTGAEYPCVDRKQAEVLKKTAGWKDGKAPAKAAASRPSNEQEG